MSVSTRARAALAALALLVLAGALAGVGVTPASALTPTPRIVGGSVSAPGAWPWQAALLDRSIPDNFQAEFCGASVIDRSWVLTAAHCVLGRVDGEAYLNPVDIDVLVGTNSLYSGGTRIHAVEVRVEPYFDDSRFHRDVALIRLDQPTTVTPIPLVAASSAELPSGTSVMATGWGALSSGGLFPAELHEVELASQSDAECGAALGPNFIASSMTCAAAPGKDTCEGDSGGPLMASLAGTWTLVGITSWGDGCADPLYPGVYTDVRAFTSWIRWQIRFGPHPDAVSFVRRQHLDLFDRAPTNPELFYGVVGLNGGTAPAAYAETLLSSAAHQDRTGGLIRLYRAYFLRDPDTSGLAYWWQQVMRGRSLAATSQFFSASSEFQNRYGALDNSAFVELVYQNVLGRPADSGGLRYWSGVLDAGTRTRGQVMLGFSESSEYRTASKARVDVISRVFPLLRRVPTAGEVTTLLASSPAAVTATLLKSLEYAERF